MKKVIAVILILMLCFGLAGCSGNPPPASSAAESSAAAKPKQIKETFDQLTYRVPETWFLAGDSDTKEDASRAYFPREDSNAIISFLLNKTGIMGSQKEEVIKGYKEIDNTEKLVTEDLKAAGLDALKICYGTIMRDRQKEETQFTAAVYIIDLPTGMLQISFAVPDEDENKNIYTEEFEEMISSLELLPQPTQTPAPTPTPAPTAEPTPTAEPEPTAEPTPTPVPMTSGQSGALSRARSYLKSSAFSHGGLVNQLEYEEFSNEDAVFAADNCGADWNEQALKKAKSYLKSSAFSYSGLLSQLAFEQFTSDEAAYGADNCGADWNEQAVKKAKSYLRTSDFSRDGLISQLEYEGFTYDEAVYGVDQNGL